MAGLSASKEILESRPLEMAIVVLPAWTTSVTTQNFLFQRSCAMSDLTISPSLALLAMRVVRHSAASKNTEFSLENATSREALANGAPPAVMEPLGEKRTSIPSPDLNSL